MNELSFPKDHYLHYSAPLEWYHFWGRLESGEFFHFSRFWTKIGALTNGAAHFSFHNGGVEFSECLEDDFGLTKDATSYSIAFRGIERFSFANDKLSVVAYPQCKPVKHNSKVWENYYSIPWLKGEGHLLGKEVAADLWFDHVFSSPNYSHWDWVGLKLNCGLAVTAFNSSIESFCSVTLKDNRIESDFTLDEKHFYLPQLGSCLTLEPVEEEVIFIPKFGPRYSEQPVEVLTKGKSIGYGMRERTYTGGKDGHS